MNKKREAWLEQYKCNVESLEKEVIEEKNKNHKHVEFLFNKLEDGPGGYFIGFDGRKTKYIGLTSSEKEDWMNQCQYVPDFEEYINNFRSKER